MHWLATAIRPSGPPISIGWRVSGGCSAIAVSSTGAHPIHATATTCSFSSRRWHLDPIHLPRYRIPAESRCGPALEGRGEGGVVAFRGIPHTALIVGPLRPRAPQPAALWKDTRSARDFGRSALRKPLIWTRTCPPRILRTVFINAWKTDRSNRKAPPRDRLEPRTGCACSDDDERDFRSPSLGARREWSPKAFTLMRTPPRRWSPGSRENSRHMS